jgi:LPXTG-site transpeptidase (sortase) family protein
MAEVGWYSAGTIPGEAGSAVLDGHLGIDEWGVCADLNKLEIGDSLRVIDAQGKVATFKVRDKQIYQRDLRLEDVFFNRQGDTIAHLNLITCSGAYNKNTGGTSSRLVVFTDLQEF